ncbi:TPA: 30S ribosomal protein S2 [Patescibacteria group bacterium]|nr:30S ribosomal protein S2 [Patescibacteria group bacterium]
MVTKTSKIEEDKKEVNKKKKVANELNIQDMFESGLHFGHSKTRSNPKMKPYISFNKNSVDIIDVEKTAEKLADALDFLKDAVDRKDTILFVGTRLQVKNLVKELAEELKMPYVVDRWLGGTLTNFEIISERVSDYSELKKKKESGEFKKYTKKERLKIDKGLQKMGRKFEGLVALKKLPDCIFVADIHHDYLAVKEANKKKISVVAICDTNTDPTKVTYPIPANDDAILSIKYIFGKIREVLS